MNLTWVKQLITNNWEILLTIVIGLIVLFVIYKWVNRKPKKPALQGKSISSNILEARQQLRELDMLLENLEQYFQRVENAVLMRKPA